jgi:hypothetical protein
MSTNLITPERMRSLLEEVEKPQTVRGVFYRAVARGLIEATESGYEAVVWMLDNMPPWRLYRRAVEPSR